MIRWNSFGLSTLSATGHTRFSTKNINFQCSMSNIYQLNAIAVERTRIFKVHNFNIHHSIMCLIDFLLMALDQCLNIHNAYGYTPVQSISFPNDNSTYFVNKLDALSRKHWFILLLTIIYIFIYSAHMCVHCTP